MTWSWILRKISYTNNWLWHLQHINLQFMMMIIDVVSWGSLVLMAFPSCQKCHIHHLKISFSSLCLMNCNGDTEKHYTRHRLYKSLCISFTTLNVIAIKNLINITYTLNCQYPSYQIQTSKYSIKFPSSQMSYFAEWFL